MKRFKRMMSLALVLLMCMAMAAPASAAADTELEDLEFLTPASLDESTAEVLPNEDGFIPAVPNGLGDAEAEDSEEAALLAAEIRNGVSIRSVTIYPLVVCVETGVCYRLNNVKRSRIWTVSTQSDDLKLSPANVTAFVNEALTSLSSQNDTSQYTWGVVGWNVEASVELTAQRPLRVEYKPHTSQPNEEFETTTSNVSSQYSTLSLSHNFWLPEKYNEYYYIGFSGAFYYLYTSGKEGGSMLSCGVMMNY